MVVVFIDAVLWLQSLLVWLVVVTMVTDACVVWVLVQTLVVVVVDLLVVVVCV